MTPRLLDDPALAVMLVGVSIANRVSEMLMESSSHSDILQEIHLMTAAVMKTEQGGTYQDMIEFADSVGDSFPQALLTAIRTLDSQMPKLKSVGN